MRLGQRYFAAAVLAAAGITSIAAQQPPASAQNQPTRPAAPQNDTARALVARLDLEKFKATVKGLTVFGDRREGTERNRKAVDWIEAQLKSYGCETARLTYRIPRLDMTP